MNRDARRNFLKGVIGSVGVFVCGAKSLFASPAQARPEIQLSPGVELRGFKGEHIFAMKNDDKPVAFGQRGWATHKSVEYGDLQIGFVNPIPVTIPPDAEMSCYYAFELNDWVAIAVAVPVAMELKMS